MPVSAKVVCDSISTRGIRLTTMEVTFHRMILPQVLTYRAFSRSTSSHRAIPTRKVIERSENDIAYPTFWGKNKPGMHATEEVESIDECRAVWDEIHREVVKGVKKLQALGLHKEIANRPLDPFSWVTMLISATDWENFFEQRLVGEGVQAEHRALAEAINTALASSEPEKLSIGDWHLPYVLASEKELSIREQKEISVGRCARVSYLNHAGVRSIADDCALYEKLRDANPPHMSPFEHVARPSYYADNYKSAKNFKGWVQLRWELFKK